MNNEIEIVVSSSALSVVYKGKEFFIFGANPDEDVPQVYAPLFDEVTFVDSLEELPDAKISVKTRERKISKLVPRKTSQSISSAVAKVVAEVDEATRVEKKKTRARSVASRSRVLSPLEEYQRDEVLNEIAKSFAQFPNQSREYTAQESHRIANEVFGSSSSTNVMRVAGVRAALTRNSYDFTLSDLIKNYRKANKNDSYVAK